LTYKEGSEIKMMAMADFQNGLATGDFSEETIVFNNLIETKVDFETKWEVSVKDSWHSNLILN